jgi:hypothetical protein
MRNRIKSLIVELPSNTYSHIRTERYPVRYDILRVLTTCIDDMTPQYVGYGWAFSPKRTVVALSSRSPENGVGGVGRDVISTNIPDCGVSEAIRSQVFFH